MSKKNKSALGIFMESIGLYFSNLDKFVKYMTFPVLGQISGLLLVFLLTFFYTQNLPNLVEKFAFFQDVKSLVIIAVLITLPGLIIFIKAFWEYLVAYGAVNSMVENLLKSGRVYDFDAHTELIKRRSIPFVGLWALFGLFSLVAVLPFFWVPCAVFTIYFVLVFQVFTYEPDLSPIGCVKKSLQLVKGHFASTFMLFALVASLTYVLIPQIIIVFCDVINLNNFLTNLSLPFINILPLNPLNSFLEIIYLKPLTPDVVAKSFVLTLIAQIFIQYTLPLRSILWAMWYRELNGALPKTTETKKKRTSSKKPSEKLMEESRKKYSTQKLDRNILKRAMEKDDN